MKTLFEEIGGHQAIEALVYEFQNRLKNDINLKPFYQGIDLKQLASHQRFFFAYLLGGVPEYKGRSLRESHAHLVKRGLNDSHFNALMEHLKETLVGLKITGEIQKQLIEQFENLRPEVLNR